MSSVFLASLPTDLEELRRFVGAVDDTFGGGQCPVRSPGLEDVHIVGSKCQVVSRGRSERPVEYLIVELLWKGFERSLEAVHSHAYHRLLCYFMLSCVFLRSC